MQNIDEITRYLKENLSEKRFNHTKGVAETAKSLAKRWGADAQKAFLAGLVHDCAKEVPFSKTVEFLEKSGHTLSDAERNSPGILHAPLGAVFAEEIFGIKDKEVLDAVRFHTTGRVGMTLIEKIIYIADFIEPGRMYKEAEWVRELSQNDIDKAVLKEAEFVINYNLEKGRTIHPDTINVRDYFLTLTNEGQLNES